MAVEVRDTGWVDSRSIFYRRSFVNGTLNLTRGLSISAL